MIKSVPQADHSFYCRMDASRLADFRFPTAPGQRIGDVMDVPDAIQFMSLCCGVVESGKDADSIIRINLKLYSVQISKHRKSIVGIKLTPLMN